MRSSVLLKVISPLVQRSIVGRRLSAIAQSELSLHSDPVLPVIDFSSFSSDDESRTFPDDVIDKLANACENIGFFYAIGHGVPNDLLLRALSVTRQLFELDEKIKNQYASRLFFKKSADKKTTLGSLGRGYQSVGENVTNDKRDRHEGFDLYRELEQSHRARLQFNGKDPSDRSLPDYRDLALGTNPWPREFPIFREIMMEYKSAMLQAGARVMRGIALSLNLPLNYFQSTFDDSFWVIRCIKYPAVPLHRQKIDDFGHGCGEHTDYGWLTFVNQDLDSRGCLHVRSNETSKASYISADPIVLQEQIALTCNIGDILAFFTQNKYRSTRHCVINPVEPARSRISTPFFFEPNIDVKIRVDNSSPECQYGEYLISKVRTNFNYYGNDENQTQK